MTFDQLEWGTVFTIDGASYQVYRVYSRIVTALVLSEDRQHILDPTDSVGIGLRTTVFSDLRVNKNNAGPTECAKYLQTLIDLNNIEDEEIVLRNAQQSSRTRYSRH